MKTLIIAALTAFVFAVPAKAEMILHRGNGAEVGTLDVHTSQGIPSSHVQRDLFEGLVANAADGSVIPGVAESWEVSEDGTVYTFFLRDDARWSNGDPVTAQDFAYSMRRLVDPKTGAIYAFMAKPILNAEAVTAGEMEPESLGVKVIDDHTLEITLESSTPYFISMLTHASLYPAHPPSVKKYGADWVQPGKMVSNGAFILEEWVPQSHIKLVPNPHFREADTVKLDGVVFYPTEDINTEFRMYLAGDLHVTNEIPFSQCRRVQEEMPDQSRISPYIGSYYYSFNLEKEKLQDPRVREALSLAVNRDILTSKVMCAGQPPAHGMVPPQVNNYKYKPGEWDNKPFPERLARAKRLMEEAGHGRGNPLEVEILYNTLESHKRVAVAISAMWRALGVKTKLRNEEWKVLLTSRNQGMFEVAREGWIGDYNDPYTFLEIFRSDAGQINNPRYANPEYDALLDQAQKELDLEKRAEILAKAERIFLDDHAVVPLYFYMRHYMIHPSVKGWEDNVEDRHPSRYVWIEE